MTSSSWCVVCLFGLFLGAALVSGLQAQPHAFSVEDSVRMIRFNTPSENLEKDAPLFSPDGAYFIVITSRGLPETNEIESSIWLYKTLEVQRAVDRGEPAPIPRQLLRVRAVPESETPSSHAPVIAQVRWSSDSQRLYFLGEGSGGRWRLCYVDRRYKVVHYLTRSMENVRYDLLP